MPSKLNTLPQKILGRVESNPERVWTPKDFLDMGARDAVDKALQRLARVGELRRIGHGLYDRPRVNPLTGKPTVPDYRAVIEAIARRDQARVVIDGMTAANELGLTTAVPARIEVLVDARIRPIRLGEQEIRFREAAPSRLYWAGRPAMRIVQALHWLHDVMNDHDARLDTMAHVRRILTESPHGPAIRQDLQEGLATLPIWMQELVRPVFDEMNAG